MNADKRSHYKGRKTHRIDSHEDAAMDNAETAKSKGYNLKRSENQENRIRIRKMTESDLDIVAAIESENFSTPWSRRDFARYLEDPQALFLTAEYMTEEIKAEPSEGPSMTAQTPGTALASGIPRTAAAGYIGCLFAADEGDITNVSVSSSCRKKGIGRALVSELKHLARQRGCRNIYLEVRASNEAAIRLYETQEFIPIGTRKRYYTKPVEDALLMRTELT